jgi:hypothetical protein
MIHLARIEPCLPLHDRRAQEGAVRNRGPTSGQKCRSAETRKNLRRQKVLRHSTSKRHQSGSKREGDIVFVGTRERGVER